MVGHVIAASSSALALVVALFIVFFLGSFIVFALMRRMLSAWLRSMASGVPVELFRLLGMRLRGVPIDRILEAYVRLKQGEIDVGLDALEAHHLAGGDVRRIADWMVATKAAGLDASWGQLAKADLAKRLPDVGEAAAQGPEKLAAALGSPEGQGAEA